MAVRLSSQWWDALVPEVSRLVIHDIWDFIASGRAPFLLSEQKRREVSTNMEREGQEVAEEITVRR